MAREDTKIFLGENEMPRQWYNLQADLPGPLPAVLHPATKQPIGPKDLEAIFPQSLIRQEVSTERYIRIPEEVRDAYRLWRPTPLVRAVRLEKELKTPAKIFYKNEGVSPSGSHKPNTSVAQAYYNLKDGTERLTTETGAGQWGSALSFACGLFGLECMVYMVRCSYEQKPYRKSMMQTYGAKVVASPSTRTKYGRELLKKNPKNQGSLGIAISEAIEDAVTSENTKYSLGSVLNHVLMHQTIIGLETKRQLEIAEAQPDIMIGCCGGGSNFAGFAFPFLKEKMGGKQIRFVAVEPEECPSMTRGRYAYDFGDAAQTTPLMKMHTLGHAYVPAAIHAGGLRYHGEAPLLSHVVSLGLVEPRAYEQLPVFEAAVQFARAEGIIPAPESAHAIKAAIDEAIACRKENSAKTIVFNLSGHGHFDMGAYDAFFAGKLISSKPSEAELNKAFSSIPGV